ncbi:MAG TPA: hypothetical protein VHA74_01385 [Candidatus Dojkabacteria bacterium]|nr:hypothetical protein [Candidatus Dojkabacteria bacterium]
MGEKREVHKICLDVSIEIAPEFLVRDAEMLQLRTGIGDKNNSKYTKKEFIENIKNGNVIVVMLKDDPIAYAIIKDSKIVEYYAEWGFDTPELEDLVRNFKK